MLQSVSSKIKPDVSITDESFDSGLAHRYRLFLQINDDGINYAVLNNSSNKFILLRNYLFNTANQPEKLEEILSSGEYLQGTDYKSVMISITSSRSTLIPSAFYNLNDMKKLIGFNHNLQVNDVIHSNYVRSFDLYSIFTIQKDLDDLLKSSFKNFNLLHSATSLMEGAHLEYRNNTLPGLLVNVGKKNFELVVTAGKQLLFYNLFPFETSEDFIYYILFVAEQLHINPELNPLMITGNIQKDSPLFTLLYKYFRQVSFADRPDQYDYHYQFEKLPLTYLFFFIQPGIVRIISGTYRGKIIKAPVNLPVRPTTDFAKTALFNILQFKIDFALVKVLDLFAGTGNISYEFFSRGCTEITCVDVNQSCAGFIRETFLKLKFDKAKVYRADVFHFLSDHDTQYDIIFADPPFEMKETTSTIPDIIFKGNLLKPNGWLIVEHQSSEHLVSTVAADEERKYGNVGFSIYREKKT